MSLPPASENVPAAAPQFADGIVTAELVEPAGFVPQAPSGKAAEAEAAEHSAVSPWLIFLCVFLLTFATAILLMQGGDGHGASAEPSETISRDGQAPFEK